MVQALLCLLVAAYAAAFSVFFGKSMAKTLPLGGCAVMLVMYLCAILGGLAAGYMVVLVLGAVLMAIALLVTMVQKKDARQWLNVPALWVFLICCALIAWWGQRGRPLTQFDEFSHWGLVVKSMSLYGQLGSYATGVVFPHYPPGTSLFQYLAVQIGGGYNESLLLGAQCVLLLSLLAPILGLAERPGTKTRRARLWLALPLAAMALLLPLLFYPTAYTALYVDPILGLLFGGVLFAWFSADKKDAFALFSVSLQLFSITLVKDSGAGIALIALLIIAADMLRGWKTQRTDYSTRRLVLGLALPVAAILAGRYSWKGWLALNLPEQAGAGGFDGGAGAQLAQLLGGTAPGWKYDTLVNFFTKFLDEAVCEHLLPATAFILLALLALATAFISARWRGSPAMKAYAAPLRMLGWGLLAGALVYLASMLYMYMFMFNSYEAVQVHSFARYLSSYLLGALYAFLFVALGYRFSAADEAGTAPESSKKAPGQPLRLWAMAAVLVLFVRPSHLANVTLLAPVTSQQARQDLLLYTVPAQRAETLLPPGGGTLAVVVQQGDFYVSQALDYHLLPHRVLVYRLGEDALPDIAATSLPPQEWLSEAAAAGAQYLYILSSDEAFESGYADAFAPGAEIQEGAFYRITEGGEGLWLELVE